MTTALELITTALQDLGAIAIEETPTAAEAVGALNKLNNMIDAWNIEGLMIYGAMQTVFPLVSNQGVYTLGTGGNFNIPRPSTIQSAYLRNLTSSPAQDTPLWVLTQPEYASLGFKGQTSSMPSYLYYDNNFPLMNVYLNPVPTTTQFSLVLWTERVIADLGLYDVISLPPGYKRALEANLAIELSAGYGKQVPPSVALIATRAKSDLQRKNLVLNELSIDARLAGGHYDIMTNRYL